MPVMPRMRGKAKKIAYEILGVPANIAKHKRSEEQEQINRRLIAEETIRVR